MHFICYNGKFLEAGSPVVPAQNRSFKYGDGLFETLRWHNGNFLLKELHVQRLTKSLQLLQIKAPLNFIETILSASNELCKKNNCGTSARVRWAVFREENNCAGFLIEATPLQTELYEWNEKGWTLDLYLQAQKSRDAFANLKSANYLPYTMAGLYARETGADECLLLNTSCALADGSKTNVFIIKNGHVFTPALTEGCVSGVMRQHIILSLLKTSTPVTQTQLQIKAVQAADEVFLTNAIIGICWVQSFQKTTYKNKHTKQLFKNIITPLNG